MNERTNTFERKCFRCGDSTSNGRRDTDLCQDSKALAMLMAIGECGKRLLTPGHKPDVQGPRVTASRKTELAGESCAWASQLCTAVEKCKMGFSLTGFRLEQASPEKGSRANLARCIDASALYPNSSIRNEHCHNSSETYAVVLRGMCLTVRCSCRGVTCWIVLGAKGPPPS